MKRPSVYVLASKPYGTLYVGVTSGLEHRMVQHTQGFVEGFTRKYGIKLLVYYEIHEAMDVAIKREKLLKRWRSEWKYRLIEQMNPEWRNLFNPKTGDIGFGSVDEQRCSIASPTAIESDGSPPARG